MKPVSRPHENKHSRNHGIKTKGFSLGDFFGDSGWTEYLARWFLSSTSLWDTTFDISSAWWISIKYTGSASTWRENYRYITDHTLPSMSGAYPEVTDSSAAWRPSSLIHPSINRIATWNPRNLAQIKFVEEYAWHNGLRSRLGQSSGSRWALSKASNSL